MNFASPFVYENVTEESYEVVSDEEFDHGMHLSDSGGSEEEEEEEEEANKGQAKGEPEPPPKYMSLAATASDVSNAEKTPSLMNRMMGMIYSSLSTSVPPPASLPKFEPAPRPRSAASEGSGASRFKLKGGSSRHHWRSTTPGESPSSTGRKFRRADTNIVSLRFNTLKKPSTMHAGEAIQCGGCEAMMSGISCLQDDGPDKVWQCEFCGHRSLVDIEEEEKPGAEDVTYLLEAAPSTAASSSLGRDESIVVFCIDISGSMTITTEVPGHQRLRGSTTLRRLRRENSVEGSQRLPSESRDVTYISRLQAVQAAVDHQLEEMAKEFPYRRIALITFSSEVTVIGDGSGTPVTVSGQKLTNKEELLKVGAELDMPKAIKEVRASLSDKIFGLEEGGSTALGPAMVVALGLASRHPGSKVILCTDGKSNEGVGKVENLQPTDPTPDLFYDDISTIATSKGVSVSVITIQGTDCKLIQLGKLADSTGGQVNIVDPLKLTEEFRNVLADRIIATSVVATFIVHKHLYIGQEENDACKERREIGNVNSDHEISFEFGVRRRKAKEPKKPKSNPLDRISELSTSMEASTLSPLPTTTTTTADANKTGTDVVDTTPAQTPAQTPAAADNTATTPAAGDNIAKTPEVGDNSAKTQEVGDNLPKTPEAGDQIAKTPEAAPGKENTAATTSPGTTQTSTTAEAGASAGGRAEKKGDNDDAAMPSELPFQVQITYTDADGTKALRVLTQRKPVTKDRNVAEREVDMSVLALHTERRSSELALQGDYSGSRGVALMNQRLGWRSSHSSNDDNKRRLYRQMFSRVKTVENSVSNAQMKERTTYGRTHSDDEDDFEEAEAPVPFTSPPRPKLSKMKMRSAEVNDSLAHLLYSSHSVSPRVFTSTPPQRPSQDKDCNKGDTSHKRDGTTADKKDGATADKKDSAGTDERDAAAANKKDGAAAEESLGATANKESM